jgi:hypothetical protein
MFLWFAQENYEIPLNPFRISTQLSKPRQRSFLITFGRTGLESSLVDADAATSGPSPRDQALVDATLRIEEPHQTGPTNHILIQWRTKMSAGEVRESARFDAAPSQTRNSVYSVTNLR